MKTHLRYFIILFSWRSYKILQNIPKSLCEEWLLHWKSINRILLQLAQGKVELSIAILRFVHSRIILGTCLNWKTILVKSSKKTKVNVNFLFKLRFHLGKVEKKQHKIKLKKLPSLSPNSVYKVAH